VESVAAIVEVDCNELFAGRQDVAEVQVGMNEPLPLWKLPFELAQLFQH
jgi:hypothetical protein